MDNLTKMQRRHAMSQVRASNTKPELLLRRALHSRGYRYVLHDRRLPGAPDLVFPARQKIILVHGCFWHQHLPCKYSAPPSSRVDFWLPKLAGNKARDRKNIRMLKSLGWGVMVVWECELRGRFDRTIERVIEFLN
jgi:DNA mismatch endonuclease, patch repair protein